MELADGAIADHFGKLVIMVHRAVFEAGGEDSPGALHRLDEFSTLGDRERGLLANDVFLSLESHQGHWSVPMVGRGDADRVDILARQELTEVVGDVAIPRAVVVVHGATGRLAFLWLHITNREHLAILFLQECFEVPSEALDPCADEPHRHLVRWGLGTQDTRRHDPWRRYSRESCSF